MIHLNDITVWFCVVEFVPLDHGPMEVGLLASQCVFASLNVLVPRARCCGKAGLYLQIRHSSVFFNNLLSIQLYSSKYQKLEDTGEKRTERTLGKEFQNYAKGGIEK